MEDYFRRGMILCSGDVSVFFTRPVCVALIGMTLFALAVSLWFVHKERRREADAGKQ